MATAKRKIQHYVNEANEHALKHEISFFQFVQITNIRVTAPSSDILC